jgi:hypothetical protein
VDACHRIGNAGVEARVDATVLGSLEMPRTDWATTKGRDAADTERRLLELLAVGIRESLSFREWWLTD